jgi:hypothetical protein
MSIATNSYGSIEEIADLAPQYTISGVYTDGTRPTVEAVERFIDRISATLNALLAQAGFAIPVTNADAKLVCDEFVTESVVDLVDAVNRTGRFYRDRLGSKSRWAMIREDAEEFIGEHAAGFEALGAERTYHLTYGLDYNDQDDAGDDIEPIFQRKMMRQTVVDWDTE